MATPRGLLTPTLICCGLVISLWGTKLDSERPSTLIVWNVGQGQWVTIVQDRTCWHFDTGGERAPWAALMRACRGRRNILSYSHWDWDHISFAAQIPARLTDACVLYRPVGRGSPRKENLFARLKSCGRLTAPFPSWVDEAGRTANDKSRVALWNQILIPGDSTSREEKFWVEAFAELPFTRILVLGHHGSRTSTSLHLLNHLPSLRMGVSSARRRKYGHPHFQVERELRRRHVPLLRTEEWGTLRFEL